MSGSCQWIFLVAVGLVPELVQAQAVPPRAAFKPQPIAEAGWMRRVAEQQGALTNQPCQTCFIGDSLTEFWLHTGRATWDAIFAPMKPINLGLAADRTEHILNRIQRLEFRRANPKVIVLMMGTNNLGMTPPDSPEDVARAVTTGVSLLRTKLPKASILVLGIPPSGGTPNSPLRQRIRQTNVLLKEGKWPDGVQYLNVYPELVDDSDRWRANFTIDGTHFSEAGYAHLGGLISPVIAGLLR